MPEYESNHQACGLRITPSTTSDNLSPQETTEESSGMVGADEASLSCPGSGEVAGSGRDDSDLNPLIKSPVERPPEDSQEQESLAKGEDP